MNDLKPLKPQQLVVPISSGGRRPAFVDIQLYDGAHMESASEDRRLDFQLEFRAQRVTLKGYGDLRIGLVDVEVELDLLDLETCVRRFPPMTQMRDFDVDVEVTDADPRLGPKVEAGVDISAAAKALAGIPSEEVPLKFGLQGGDRQAETKRYQRQFKGIEVDRSVDQSGAHASITFRMATDQRWGVNAHLTGACTIDFMATQLGNGPAVIANSVSIRKHSYKIIQDSLSERFPGRLNIARAILVRALERRLQGLGPLIATRWDLANV